MMLLHLLQLLLLNLRVAWHEWRTKERFEHMSAEWRPERRSYREEEL